MQYKETEKNNTESKRARQVQRDREKMATQGDRQKKHRTERPTEKGQNRETDRKKSKT